MEFTHQKYTLPNNLLMLPLFKRYFSILPLSYSYGVIVDSIGIPDSNAATLVYDDDHFRAQRVSEKGIKCNKNNPISFPYPFSQFIFVCKRFHCVLCTWRMQVSTNRQFKSEVMDALKASLQNTYSSCIKWDSAIKNCVDFGFNILTSEARVSLEMLFNSVTLWFKLIYSDCVNILGASPLRVLHRLTYWPVGRRLFIVAI